MRHRLSIFPPWTMSFLGEVCMSLAELVTPQDGEQCRRIISGAFQLASLPRPYPFQQLSHTVGGNQCSMSSPE